MSATRCEGLELTERHHVLPRAESSQADPAVQPLPGVTTSAGERS